MRAECLPGPAGNAAIDGKREWRVYEFIAKAMLSGEDRNIVDDNKGTAIASNNHLPQIVAKIILFPSAEAAAAPKLMGLLWGSDAFSMGTGSRTDNPVLHGS